MKRVIFTLLAAIWLVGCGPVKPQVTPNGPVPAITDRYVRVTVWAGGQPLDGGNVVLTADTGETVPCVGSPRLECKLRSTMTTGWGATLNVTAPGYVSANERVVLGENVDADDITLQPERPAVAPLPASKADTIHSFQANFGSIKLPGCGLHMDSLFDPFLLIKWVEDKPCFERMMQAHIDRGDNFVAVDPRSGYHGHNDVDLWHQPELFAQFLADVRSHYNNRGEPIRVMVFMAGDGHIGNMRDPGAYAHWTGDVSALQLAAEPYVDMTVVCWECRHQNDYVSAKIYTDMGKFLAVKFPQAIHAQHLIAGSSSWSSWPCDPQQPGSCQNPGDGPPANDADDPNRGNEAAAWANCKIEGWCDALLFQFGYGRDYTHPEESPNYTGHDGAMGRWYEIVVRMGDDPQSWMTSGGNRHGWVQIPVIAFEFIYDRYWETDPVATEDYAVEWCKQALSLGGWGCGSASYRRP